MNDFLNPYIAGAPVVEPSMFFGRQDVFDWIEQNLSGRFVNHILVIHGQRRVGKTSVLKQIPNHLPSHFIHVFIDLQGRTHTSLDRFQWWLAREISRAVSQARGETIPIPEHELFVQDGEYLAVTFLPEVLSKLGESILLLTFDEFDTLSEPEIQQSLTRPLIAYLRRLFDLPNLNFIFSIGSSGHKLENMQASYTEFFKTALYRKISFLKHEDCSRLITRPVEGVLSYVPAAVERIYAITSGHPYFTQLICHELFSLSQKTGRRTLTREDVESVLEDVIERGTVNLKFVWDEANDLEKWVLSSLAHELHSLELDQRAAGIQSRPVCNDKRLASALHNQRVRYSENDLNTALIHLREKDVLTQENRFVVELLCIWMLKNRPLDRVREELVQVNPIANRYNEIGDEFRELGQMDKALDSFRQALSIDPSNLRAQVSIANLHLEGGNYTQAVQGYEAALRIDDDDIAARSGLSTALMALGEAASVADRPAEAGEYYQRVLTTNPDHPDAHQRLAVLYAHQAEAALATGEAELALQQYVRALEHAPEDSQLRARFTQAKEEHTKRLIDELLKQSQQALEQQDWEAALDTIQRALQLAPNDPAMLIRLTAVQDAPRLAKISSLRVHAQEMERLEHWDEAVHDWEACLQLKPEGEENVRQSLEVARRGQKMAGDYTQAQAAIKEGRYSQAIALLQGVIAQDAGYKDAAVLLVECLKARPKRELKLPKLPKLPAGWWRWAVPALILLLVIIGVATQWSRLSPLLAGLVQPKTPIATQAAMAVKTATQAGNVVPPATVIAADQSNISLTAWKEKMVGGRAPDVQDDFSSASLQEYWNNDDGAKKATLQDGALQLNNVFLIGKGTLNIINYLLQVDLRFSGLSGNENFVYNLRVTTSPYVDLVTGYQLTINPSRGTWLLVVMTDPNGKYTEVQKGNLDAIEAGRWYELGIVMMNETFWVYWDDQLLITQDNVNLFGPINCFGLDHTTAGEATLDIDNWRFWDLGTLAYMRNDWITDSESTVGVDTFAGGEGWQFNPVENEKYENGRAVLFTNGDETFFSREDLLATNIAMEVTFSPRDMPDTASLVCFLTADLTAGEMFTFDYFPGTGFWAIMKAENQDWNMLVSGWTQPTPPDNIGMIMVVVNGDQVSAFFGDSFLGSVESSRPGAGIDNFLSVRSKGAPFAQVDILKIGFWNLDAVEWKTSDWITFRPETVLIDSFTSNEGLQFSPEENGTYVDGKAVLFTKAGETSLTRDGLHGENIAMEVSFIPRNMPDSASLVWALGEDNTTLDCLEFSYFSKTGEWQINKVVNRQWQLLSSGMTQPTPEGSGVTIMVVAGGDQVRVYLNQEHIGSAEVDRSGTSTRNELAIRERENLYARVDINLIRFWDLGLVKQASGEGSASLSETINTMTDGRPPDLQDDFSSASLQEYWNNDDGAKNATLQEGALRLNNESMIGYGSLPSINYILQVDLRFAGLSGNEEFVYSIRTTEFDYTSNGTEYLLSIIPSNGDWKLLVMTDPHGEYSVTYSGNLGGIEAGRWYELGVVADTETISIYWDDSLLCTEDSYKLYGVDDHFGLSPPTAGQATLDIDNWRFWDLGTSAYMRNDWVSETNPTFMEDNFLLTDGFEFGPHENGEFKDYKAVLFTDGNETRLVHSKLSATNFAMEASFISRDMPDTASVVFFHRIKDASTRQLAIEYFPVTGFWQIAWDSPQSVLLTSGWTQPTLQDDTGTIMVLVDGDRLSAFLGDTFLGSAESDLWVTQTSNEFGIRNFEGQYAQVDVEKIRFWNLDTPEMMIPERIYLRTPTVEEDNFVPGEGWHFGPPENEKYDDGRAVLFTNGGDSELTRNEIKGTNGALYIAFIPRTMPETAALVWFMRENTSGDSMFSFEYHPATGFWSIWKVENHVPDLLASGTTQVTAIDSMNDIMVVMIGDRVSAFMGNTFLGSAESSLSNAGYMNWLLIRSDQGTFAQVDIVKFVYWSLDR